jgi:hypothetical protein
MHIGGTLRDHYTLSLGNEGGGRLEKEYWRGGRLIAELFRVLSKVAA